MSINHTIFQGNLTRDPELRVTPQGSAVCSFAIAHNKKWTAENGEKKEKVIFLECTAWGKTGEMIAKWFGKGGQIMVEGELVMDEWDDKNTGAKRTQIKLNVVRPHFCGPTGIDRQNGDQPRRETPAENFKRHTAPAQQRQAPAPQENLDEDLPF
jgi:single-strand DNA-binding protein